MMSSYQAHDRIMSSPSTAPWKQSLVKILHKKTLKILESVLALIMRKLVHKLMLVLTQTMPDIF